MIGVIWMVANGSSIPMLFEYHINQMEVVQIGRDENEVISWTKADFCAIRSHQSMTTYVSLIFTLIFLPLMLAFLTLYGIIGCYLWRRYPNGRRSAVQRYREILALKRAASRRRGLSLHTDSTLVGASVLGAAAPPPLPPRPVAPRVSPLRLLARKRLACAVNKPTRRRMETILEHESLSEMAVTNPSTPQCSSNQDAPPLPSRGIRVMERQKKRVLKIIFVLMVTFIITRMPIWCLNVIHASTTEVANYWWMMQYLLSALSLLGTVLNPYLYGFMQERQTNGETCFPCRLINRTREHLRGEVEMNPRGGDAGENVH
ncbi:uncharacterized protein LOC124170934 isoform X2 [Ischnura elegans]|nr:uncharacterized protein LOC124170934 isoform X2 [Ischnura elegans]